MITYLSRKRSGADGQGSAVLIDFRVMVLRDQAVELVEFVFTGSIGKAIA
jgi:hypothetical protein